MTLLSRFDDLHERASALTGHHDFGAADYHDALKRLLKSADDDIQSDAGRGLAEGLVISLLQSRLITQASWNANPEWRTQAIVRPVVVIGVPRTGTTALHQLLSLDPQFQGIERWLIFGPKRRPPRETWDDDAQFREVCEKISSDIAASPDVMAAHSTQADEVDECLSPMAQSFVSNFLPSLLDIPGYDAWFRSQSETASYQRFADVLKLIGLGDDRRWLLKNPSHVFGIDALLAVFPDACVIQTHRHPAQSMASLANLLGGFRELATGVSADQATIAQREISFWSEATRRSMAAQARQPDRFVNVWQNEMRADPLRIIERIYKAFDLILSDDTRDRMQLWADAAALPAASAHAYPLIRREDIEDAFRAYIDTYHLGEKARA